MFLAVSVLHFSNSVCRLRWWDMFVPSVHNERYIRLLTLLSNSSHLKLSIIGLWSSTDWHEFFQSPFLLMFLCSLWRFSAVVLSGSAGSHIGSWAQSNSAAVGLGCNSRLTCIFSFADMANFVVVNHFSPIAVGWAPSYQIRATPNGDLVKADCTMLCANCDGQKNSWESVYSEMNST